MINAEVSKSGNESPLSIIRKFSRKVQGTGLVQNARKRRYFSRAASKAVTKKRALKRIARRDSYHEMLKEGKVIEAPKRGSRAPVTMSAAQQVREPSTTGRFGEDTPIAR
jgi:ribosomal protein S21